MVSPFRGSSVGNVMLVFMVRRANAVECVAVAVAASRSRSAAEVDVGSEGDLLADRGASVVVVDELGQVALEVAPELVALRVGVGVEPPRMDGEAGPNDIMGAVDGRDVIGVASVGIPVIA